MHQSSLWPTYYKHFFKWFPPLRLSWDTKIPFIQLRWGTTGKVGHVLGAKKPSCRHTRTTHWNDRAFFWTVTLCQAAGTFLYKWISQLAFVTFRRSNRSVHALPIQLECSYRFDLRDTIVLLYLVRKQTVFAGYSPKYSTSSEFELLGCIVVSYWETATHTKHLIE